MCVCSTPTFKPSPASGPSSASGSHGWLALGPGREYNPSVKGIPTPVSLTRDAGQGPLDLMIADAMALSKMDWNNDAPFDGEPVTMRYSANLAKVIGHVPPLPDDVYQYRLFM